MKIRCPGNLQLSQLAYRFHFKLKVSVKKYLKNSFSHLDYRSRSDRGHGSNE